ncbi:MAG TPA: hypothetical protein VMU84_16970 [Thermoanaerobaculia bacterium]|nr:hypothetical protein [Thermoanaerobaculia bacterium]
MAIAHSAAARRASEGLTRAAIGLRAKTGRAIAVVLRESDRGAQFVWRGEVSLVDPKVPATAEPYHEVMELPWSDATREVQPLIVAIENAATKAIEALVEEHNIVALGVVGSPPRDLVKLGNLHIRAHAAEGILFRCVLEVAAERCHIACVAYSDRNFAMSDAATLKELGRVAGPPWRTDERMAATAAWNALNSPRP